MGLTSSSGMKLSPFKLSFQGKEEIFESEFLEEYSQKSLGAYRLALVFALIFYDVFAILDVTVVPEVYLKLWTIRFGIVTPLLILGFAASYMKHFSKYMQIVIVFMWMVTGTGIIVMNYYVSLYGIYSYYAGLILVFIFGYTFIRARFKNAIFTGWTIFILYEISATLFSDTPVTEFLTNNAFFLSANIIGMMINYTQERSFRNDFFLRKLLLREQEKVKATNEALEKRVQERTAQLTQTNLELKVEMEKRHQYEEERKKLEAQLLQLQKMETIGTLAGGIAHDFNNILTPILGYTEMALEELEEESNLQFDIEQINNAALRAKDLVQQILTFSRQVEVDKKPLQMHHVIREALNLVKASFPSNIEIRLDLDPNCGTVMADATQIHQVIMNLCTNAYHSMMETGGTLRVSLRVIKATNSLIKKVPKLIRGSYICTTISDSGTGMDRQTLTRIFEPFFTKKEVGIGSGLGLSVVHGIISSYEGAIEVESTVGEGTTFRIYLPQHSRQLPVNKNANQALTKGREHILFIDDEEEITFMGKRMLESLGYNVTVYTNSLTALEDFSSNPKEYDLIVTDQTMPYMLGTELIEHFREFRPDIKSIIITGFGDSISKQTIQEKKIDAIIIKPLILSNFSNLIRKILDKDTNQKGKTHGKNTGNR